MKKIFLLLFLCIGCVSESTQLDKLKSPIVVVAIGKLHTNGYEGSASIVLKSGDGKIVSFGFHTDVAQAISGSRQVGDTLR